MTNIGLPGQLTDACVCARVRPFHKASHQRFIASEKRAYGDWSISAVFYECIDLFTSTQNEDPPGGDLFVNGGTSLSSSIAKWGTAHTPDSLKFASSPSCGLQFANCSHRVPAIARCAGR